MTAGNFGFTFDDVLLVPGYNGIKSRQLVTTRASLAGFDFEIPVASSNMDKITGPEMARFMAKNGGLGILHRFMSIDENVDAFQQAGDPEHVGISIGIGDKAMERAEALAAVGCQIICVDVAHGHSKGVNRTVRRLKEIFKDNVLVIAGNVATYAGADYLAAAGADVIKVGIGCGSVCSTRIKTGYGVPQLTAIQNCSRIDRPLIADGGIKTPADAVKALAAGATMVMLGGMLAGTDETPGDVYERTGPDGTIQKYKKFRGMASQEAQEDFMGQMSGWKTAEGVEIQVGCQGPASEVLKDLMGGIRSGMTYCGASDLATLKRKAEFIRITTAGAYEGTPHGRGRLGEA